MGFYIDVASQLRALLCVTARLLLDSRDWKRIVMYELVLHMAIGRPDHVKLSGIILIHSTVMLLFICSDRIMRTCTNGLRRLLALFTLVFTICVACELFRAIFSLNLRFSQFLRTSLFYMLYVEHALESIPIHRLSSYCQNKNLRGW